LKDESEDLPHIHGFLDKWMIGKETQVKSES